MALQLKALQLNALQLRLLSSLLLSPVQAGLPRQAIEASYRITMTSGRTVKSVIWPCGQSSAPLPLCALAHLSKRQKRSRYYCAPVLSGSGQIFLSGLGQIFLTGRSRSGQYSRHVISNVGHKTLHHAARDDGR